MSDDKPTVELPTVAPEDTHNFRIAMALVWPRWYQLTWWHRSFMHITRWWRLRIVVTAIDQANGIIVYGTERWSWRRWRWERVA